jgi:hypothetical protein
MIFSTLLQSKTKKCILLINSKKDVNYMVYKGSAQDFLKEYEAHNFISDQWYKERSEEERIALSQRAIELPGIPIQNFGRLIEQRWLGQY